MRTAAVLLASVAFVVGAACTYDVPEVKKAATDGGAHDAHAVVEASLDAPGDGSSGKPDGSDSGQGQPDTGSMVDAPCTGVLCHCSNAADCSPSAPICADEITVGAAFFAVTGGSDFCTAPCCTSADCPAGSVCFASGVGGQYCVAPAWLMRSAPAASARGGAVCGKDADCRSGLCAGGACADTCCSFAESSAECAVPTACVFGTFPGKIGDDTHFAPHCGPLGASPDGSSCIGDGDCQGGLCAGGFCTSPCRTLDDCGGGTVCDFDATNPQIYWACFLESLGSTPEGQSCSGNDSQCQTNWCGPNGLCEGECFTDADCSMVPGWKCKPQSGMTSMGTYDFLICQP